MPSKFFALFDDIAVLMDDVAAMSKIATKKTAGILADDLAVNAEKASGFMSNREIPVLWRIAKGSFISKLIILPIAFLLSAYFPASIVPILMVGGLYLAYEGAEKIFEYFFVKKSAEDKINLAEMSEADKIGYENEKIKAAIIVDFILSVEIVIIALGTVATEPLNMQIIVVSVVAILATVGVYGLVALLVRMDDVGYQLIKSSNGKASIASGVGTALVKTLPVIVRALGVIGTLAMILVAGGIFVHNLDYFHDKFAALPGILVEFVVGLIVGIVTLILVKLVLKVANLKG